MTIIKRICPDSDFSRWKERSLQHELGGFGSIDNVIPASFQGSHADEGSHSITEIKLRFNESDWSFFSEYSHKFTEKVRDWKVYDRW